MKRIIVVFGICIAFLAGCKKAETTAPSAPAPEARKSILIGLIPEQNLFKQLDRYKPVAAYLSRKIGVNIKLTVLPRYGNIIDNFVSSGMDGAFFGSFTYALAHSKIGVEALARPVADDGTSTYYGLIFVRKDSGITEAGDMEGKRFAFVDKATTAGYLLPLAYFKENGIKDYKSFLGETYFTGTHEDAIYDVLNRRADIGAAKNTIYQRVAETDSRIMEQLMVLEKSPEVPENGLAVRASMAEELKRRISETLLGMHEDPEGRRVLERFGAKRFIPTTDDDYKPVFDYARKIDLDLHTYNYIND
jgi:phosphonate transport system substrate-binding protein